MITVGSTVRIKAKVKAAWEKQGIYFPEACAGEMTVMEIEKPTVQDGVRYGGTRVSVQVEERSDRWYNFEMKDVEEI